MSLVGRELFKSLVGRYRSEIQSNKTILMIYFENSVGIGEHPQHLDEMNEILSKISESNDKLENLFKHFGDEYK